MDLAEETPNLETIQGTTKDSNGETDCLGQEETLVSWVLGEHRHEGV